MRNSLVLLVFLFSLLKFHAQSIKGTVLNTLTNEPIENAKVVILNSGVHYFSNNLGEFSIDSAEFPFSVDISAAGFRSQKVNITKTQFFLEFYLYPEAELLSEVIINSGLIPKKYKNIPASIRVLSAGDINKVDPISLMESFRSVPGVYVNRGALNTNKINIRGIGSRSQFSTNRIQAFLNEIPLTTGEGELTLDDIDPETISKIEIIKGPTSSIYGAGLGGVIKLYTNNYKRETGASVSSTFGSYNTIKNIIGVNYAAAKSAFNANITHVSSDGYRENSQYDRKSALISADIYKTQKSEISILGNFTRLKAFIPSSLSEENFINNPQTAAFTWKASKGFESYDKGLLGLSFSHGFSKLFSNNTSVFMSFRDGYEPRPFNILKEDQVAKGIRSRFNLNNQIFNKDVKLSLGAEYYFENYKASTFENLYAKVENNSNDKGDRLSQNQQDRFYYNLFGEVNVELSSRFLLEAGANLNITNYRLNDLFDADNIDQSGDYKFQSILSPRIGANYEVTENKNLYTSISHGFSTPTVAETLTPEGLINTEIKQETGVNYEIGFKGSWLNEKLYSEITVYTVQVKDLLVAKRVAEDQFVGLNAGKTRHSGLEIYLDHKMNLTSNIKLRTYMNSSFNMFKFLEFEDRGIDFSDNKLPGVPKSTFNLGLDILVGESLKLFTSFNSVGEIPLNDSNSLFTNNYELLNLKAEYRIDLINKLDIKLNAGINNITNERYAASVLPNAVGFGNSAPRYYYPGNPRNYYVGAKLNYNL